MKDPAAVSLGRRGGLAKAAAMTPEQRSAEASKAQRKRWRGTTKAQRSEAGRRAALARWAKPQEPQE